MNYVHDIRVQLETILVENPDNDSLKAALNHLSQLERDLSSPNKSTLLALVSDLRHLQGQGLWGLVEEQIQLFNALSQDLHHFKPPSISRLDLSIDMPPSTYKVPMVHVATLPPELLEQINEVYLLHILAIYPHKILPAGKSLLSVFSSQSRRTDESGSSTTQTLKVQVSEVLTRAFWDEVPYSLLLSVSQS
jgi:hypothetical protein